MVEKREPPFKLDMPFDEALQRFAQTAPKEVQSAMQKPVQTDFKAKLDTVNFHGQVLQIVDREGRPYVPVKTICVNLGIDWEGQRQRIERDQVLSEGACIIQAPSPGGTQARDNATAQENAGLQSRCSGTFLSR